MKRQKRIQIRILCSGKERVKFQKGDAAKLDFQDGTFDAAVSKIEGVALHPVRVSIV